MFDLASSIQRRLISPGQGGSLLDKWPPSLPPGGSAIPRLVQSFVHPEGSVVKEDEIHPLALGKVQLSGHTHRQYTVLYRT